ncbi:hypothetical protein TNCV_4297001 [Trichonephila clavipes]|nr:hypothetical protein TNCV_4297001 [Trichonephila clavipes]
MLLLSCVFILGYIRNTSEEQKAYNTNGREYRHLLQMMIPAYNRNGGRGSLVVNVTDSRSSVMSSISEPLKIYRSDVADVVDQTSSRWYGVEVRRGGASSGYLNMVQNDVVRRKSP